MNSIRTEIASRELITIENQGLEKLRDYYLSKNEEGGYYAVINTTNRGHILEGPYKNIKEISGRLEAITSTVGHENILGTVSKPFGKQNYAGVVASTQPKPIYTSNNFIRIITDIYLFFEKNRKPVLLSLLVIAIGLVIFLLVYFLVIKPKKKKNKNNS